VNSKSRGRAVIPLHKVRSSHSSVRLYVSFSRYNRSVYRGSLLISRLI